MESSGNDDDLTNETETCIFNPDGVFGIHRCSARDLLRQKTRGGSVSFTALSDWIVAGSTTEYPGRLQRCGAQARPLGCSVSVPDAPQIIEPEEPGSSSTSPNAQKTCAARNVFKNKFIERKYQSDV
jgi:hypothetical protein